MSLQALRPEPLVRLARSPGLRPAAFALYMALLIGIGITLAFRATPMSGIDEMFHYKRALQVSEGHFLARRLGGDDWGGKLDRRSLDYESWFDTLREGHRTATMAGASAVRARINAEPDGAALDHFPSTASYSPIPYLPAAFGLIVGRSLGADLQGEIYAGRIGSLAGYAVLLVATILMLPAGKAGALAILSTPTAIHLASSYSADPVTNTLGGLLAACCLRLRSGNGTGFSTRRKVLFLALAFAVGLLKLTCALLGLLCLLVPAAAFASAGRAWGFRLLAAGLCFGAAAGWNLAYPFVPGLYWGSGGDPGRSLHLIITMPGRETLLVARDIAAHWFWWWVDGYSRFCTGPLPFYFLFNGASAVAAFGLVWLTGVAEAEGRTDRWAALLLAVIGAGYGLEVLLAFKIGFSPPLSREIIGLQGRYFLLPLLLGYLAFVGAAPRLVRMRALVPVLLGAYMVLTLHLAVALLGDYAPLWR